MTFLGLGGHELGLFMLASLVLNATPGVDLLLTVSRTLQGGARAGAAAAAGIALGCGLHALAAAFGLASLLAVLPLAFVALQWAGAAYLLWLAFGLARRAWRGPAAPDPAAVPTVRGAGADFRSGLLTNVLNPKMALFFLAFLPQFIGADVADKTQAFLALGFVFVVQSLLFLLVLVALVARLRPRHGSPRAARALQAVGAALFAALAWRLLAARAS
ncbi:MAG: LysE family translocator [Burkholderiales bacterium]|nr:LysE family translocator [Burkholderiales bacterium]